METHDSVIIISLDSLVIDKIGLYCCEHVKWFCYHEMMMRFFSNLWSVQRSAQYRLLCYYLSFQFQLHDYLCSIAAHAAMG